MKTTIQTKAAGAIEINSVFHGNKAWENTTTGRANYNHHRITVKNNGKRLTFDFWGSIAKPQITTDEENIFALDCFISDSIIGKDSFEEMCNSLGYDQDSRTAERTHRACVKSAKKFDRVFQADIYEISSELQENYNC